MFFPFTQHAAAATVRMHKSQAVSFVCSSECKCMKSTGDMVSATTKIQIKNTSSSFVLQSADSMEKHVVVFWFYMFFILQVFTFLKFSMAMAVFQEMIVGIPADCLPLVNLFEREKQNKIIETFTVNTLQYAQYLTALFIHLFGLAVFFNLSRVSIIFIDICRPCFNVCWFV